MVRCAIPCRWIKAGRRQLLLVMVVMTLIKDGQVVLQHGVRICGTSQCGRQGAAQGGIDELVRPSASIRHSNDNDNSFSFDLFNHVVARKRKGRKINKDDD